LAKFASQITKTPLKIPTTQFYSSQNDFNLNSTLNHQKFELHAKIETAFLARQFINTLSLNERLIIKEELVKAEQEAQANGK
jgi:hypothetical protein